LSDIYNTKNQEKAKFCRNITCQVIMIFYLIYFSTSLLINILVFINISGRKKYRTDQLFFEGLRNENDGHLQEAVSTYQIALDENKKSWVYWKLKNIVIQKINFLHTVMDYQKNMCDQTAV